MIPERTSLLRIRLENEADADNKIVTNERPVGSVKLLLRPTGGRCVPNRRRLVRNVSLVFLDTSMMHGFVVADALVLYRARGYVWSKQVIIMKNVLMGKERKNERLSWF